jgi:beta-galactosidase
VVDSIEEYPREGVSLPVNTLRQRTRLAEGWKFALGHAADASKDFEFARDRSLVKSGEARGAAGPGFDDSGWRTVDLPHDWAIELPVEPIDDREFCEHGFRAIGPAHPHHSVGWYRRTFDIPAADLGRRIAVEFDGVFRDSIAWINGHRLGRHASGYTPFRYDLTDLLNYGGANVLAVRADATGYEGWWYEGAGIHRHVWLTKTAPLHVAPDGVVVRTRVGRESARVTVRTTVQNESDRSAEFVLRSTVNDPAGRAVGRAATPARLGPWQRREVVQAIHVRRPRLWSCEEPNLYALHSTIAVGRRPVDAVAISFGIRSIRFDARRGFLLNGKPVKIKGTCNHHQHAGVGTAVPDALQRWRLRKLKRLGSNAYRCSHYMVPPETLDECDRLGLLVMAENRLAGGGPEFLTDFETMVRRHRNHPSVILWSIGNEEHTIQWSIAGERIGQTLRRAARRLDPTRPVTAAMHDRGLGAGFANVVDVHGWNYIAVGDIEAYHRRRPGQPIVSSEEGSTVCTRGAYVDDATFGYVSAYGKRAPKWGSLAGKWWPFVADRPWIAGAFVWTGFDYYGEPIPYKWPCTASHFGLMDLCGFPKDLYWYFKAWWNAEPVLHVLPHWTWPGREREPIDVWCFSNHHEVELLHNGVSLGRQAVPRNGHVEWRVTYAPGALRAIGYGAGRRVQTVVVETAGAAKRLVLDPDALHRRDDDVICVTVSAVDAAGRVVPDADHAVEFALSGPGRILGVGNGNPSSHEPDAAPRRRLFHGLAQVIVQKSARPGRLTLRATAPGLTSATVRVPSTGR